MNSCYHGMNSFHPKCTKHGKMLIIQLRKEVPKKFFYIIDCHHKCEFWEISLTLNSKKYVEWIHSMVPWIHSMVEWIQAQGGMNSFLVEWIHSTLGFPILLTVGQIKRKLGFSASHWLFLSIRGLGKIRHAQWNPDKCLPYFDQ